MIHFYGILSDSCGLESLIYSKELRTLKIKGFGFDDYLSNFPQQKPAILKRLLEKPWNIQLTHLDLEFIFV